MNVIGNLQRAINEAKERLLTEGRKKPIAKEYREGKRGKILPLNASSITHVEATLTDKDLPASVLAETIRAARSITDLNEQVKLATVQLTKDKEFLRPLFDELFDEGDKAFTRVLRTVVAGKKGKKLEVEVTSGKAGTNTKFDYRKFIALIKENLKDEIKLIDKLAAACTNITETANSIRVDINDVKESTINEGVISDTIKKISASIKNAVKDAISYIKDALKPIDARQKEINSYLTPALKEEAKDALLKFGITESTNEAEDTCVKTTIDLLVKILDKTWDTHHLSLKQESDGTLRLVSDNCTCKLVITKE